MKKILVVAVLILLLTGCGGTMNTEIPKGYISKTEYYDKDGIQDHTDYAKYVYDKVIVENDNNYTKVSTDDIENIKSYFNYFKDENSYLSVNEDYPRYLTAQNEKQEEDYDENISYSEEEIYTGNIVKDFGFKEDTNSIS